jgi:hypothetical protein
MGRGHLMQPVRNSRWHLKEKVPADFRDTGARPATLTPTTAIDPDSPPYKTIKVLC